MHMWAFLLSQQTNSPRGWRESPLGIISFCGMLSVTEGPVVGSARPVQRNAVLPLTCMDKDTVWLTLKEEQEVVPMKLTLWRHCVRELWMNYEGGKMCTHPLSHRFDIVFLLLRSFFYWLHFIIAVWTKRRKPAAVCHVVASRWCFCLSVPVFPAKQFL